MSIKKTIILSLILRFLIAPFFYHPDIKSQHFHFQYLSRGVLNIYQFIADNKLSLPYRDTFNYLPLTYFSLGAYHALTKPLFPQKLSLWLNDWSVTQNNYDSFPFFMLILKLPYLVFDIGVALLLLKLYGQKIFVVWLFNPLSIYLIYILGNFDIIPVFFTLFSWYLLKRNLPQFSYISLGVATAFKLYPLLFLPFFLFLKPKHFFKNILFFSLPLIFTVLPFVASQPFFLSLTNSGLSQKIIETRILNLPLFPITYLFIFLWYLRHRQIEESILLIFLSFIVLVDFHAQWLLWFLPFIMPVIAKSTYKTIVFTLLSCLCVLLVIITNDSYLFWGHLTPVNPSFVSLRSPYQLLRYRFFIDPLIMENYIKIILAVLSLSFLLKSNAKN